MWGDGGNYVMVVYRRLVMGNGWRVVECVIIPISEPGRARRHSDRTKTDSTNGYLFFEFFVFRGGCKWTTTGRSLHTSNEFFRNGGFYCPLGVR